ncbi:MAG: alpha/beta fold hydrolase [Myxococcota bacterium]
MARLPLIHVTALALSIGCAAPEPPARATTDAKPADPEPINTPTSDTEASSVDKRVLNDGNLILEDVPEIPEELVEKLNRYQNVRSAGFLEWTEDGDALYVSTRFGDVSQVHRVDGPGGARHQMTYFREPIGALARQPSSSQLSFTRDAGGNEYAQVFMLNPTTGDSRMLTDGESRNSPPLWDREGKRFAFQSTRRNGKSNDIWIMDPERPDQARMILKSPDGTWWGPAEFSADGKQLLVMNYVSITDARIHLLDIESGDLTLLAGGESFNQPIAFDDAGKGLWFITDRLGEFRTLAWQALEKDAEAQMITSSIPWNIDGGALSDDRRRGVFVANEGGRSVAYLFDPKTRAFKRIDSLPIGVIGSMGFSPNGERLAISLDSPKTPNDTYVLDLKRNVLKFGQLTRWTFSEVGGLDTDSFREPELIEYPTFDEENGSPRTIPAWFLRPAGEGPFPVVISIHGGPEGQAQPKFSSAYQMWIKEMGVAVLSPNVRGSSGYGKTYVSLDNGFRREDSVKDIGALLDWIQTRPELDAERVAVFGGSYGGYMVLASAVHYSDRLKAAVDIVGISNFVTFLENTKDYRRDLRRQEYGDEREPEMRAHLQKISPLNNVDKITVPLFVVQGENDPRVPVSEAIQMVAALRERGSQVWYMNALNEGHGYRKKENRDIYQQATVLFLQKYLAK